MRNGLQIPKTIEDIQRLIDNRIQENLHLDYKRSEALDKNKRDEIIKDVTSFANADGGTLIYGVIEEQHLPTQLDDGVNQNSRITREWLEDILQSNIVPQINGITISQIPHKQDTSFFAIEIPKSYRGPHQANDKKFYKRYNFKAAPMDLYEITDVANRKIRTNPLILPSISFINSYFYFTLENISDLIISNVHVKFSDPFKWPNNHYPSALQNGIRSFPAKKKFYYTFCANSPNTENIQEFKLNIEYIHPEFSEKVSEHFSINFGDYLEGELRGIRSDSLENTIDRRFHSLIEVIHQLIRAIEKIKISGNK